MAWFECTTGASSGNGVALIVTTDASFAGTNITASNGEDTFTQQCPSSAPYVVTFEDIPTGTYTISGVTGGQTVSKTFVVSDYNFEFHATPTGSTATPVNVIQTWLHCADIWNKTYTTINQVLADTSTLLALISSNNAADYMARSTNWASSVSANQTAMGYIGNNNYCATKLLANSTWCNAICNSTYFESVLNAKVPTMTSDTTPSGVVSGSAPYNYNYLWYAFDNTNTKGAYSAEEPTNIIYEFPTAKKIYKWYFNSLIDLYGTAYTPSSATLYGSNNGSTWTQIGTMTGFSSSVKSKTLIIPGANAYKYYKTSATKGTNVGSGALEIQYYGRNA